MSASQLLSDSGSLMTGLVEVFGLIGAGVGFLIRSRRNARQERQRTETASRTAADEVKTRLESQLQAAHQQDLTDKDTTIEALRADLRASNLRINDLTDKLINRHDQ